MKTAHRRRPATPQESQRALAAVKQLYQRTPLEIARDAVTAAKSEVSAACQAILDNEPGCAGRGDAAAVALVQAQAELAALETTG